MGKTQETSNNTTDNLRIAVVGATGAVGTQFLNLLNQHKFHFSDIKLLASRRSAGHRIRVRGEEVAVQETTPESLNNIDIAFVSVNAEISKALAPVAAAAGTVVIDDSAAFRMDTKVPLVVPEINPSDLIQHQGIIAIPNCSTTQMVMALYPLHRQNPIKRIIVDTYQSVSGAGGMAIEELRNQSRNILENQKANVGTDSQQVAFNALPQIGDFLSNGYTTEEWKLVEETHKILHSPEIAISATCIRVPVFIGHSEALHIEFTHPMSPEEARGLLAAFPGISVIDEPEQQHYPMPILAAGRNEVLVGRIRKDASHPNGLTMWLAADNLRKGAALNALQIADELVRQKLVRLPTKDNVWLN